MACFMQFHSVSSASPPPLRFPQPASLLAATHIPKYHESRGTRVVLSQYSRIKRVFVRLEYSGRERTDRYLSKVTRLSV